MPQHMEPDRQNDTRQYWEFVGPLDIVVSDYHIMGITYAPYWFPPAHILEISTWLIPDGIDVSGLSKETPWRPMADYETSSSAQFIPTVTLAERQFL